MLVTARWIYDNYSKFNNLYFGGLLPNITFKITRSSKTWGYAEYRYDYNNSTIIPVCIAISNYFDSPENVKLNTLLHEMIHIADYTFHPEHYIRNGKKINGHHYNPHGYFFKDEANRLKEFGWEIERYVTEEEKAVSTLSVRSKQCLDNKKNKALACVVETPSRAFVFKTDINQEINVLSTIKRIGYRSWRRFFYGEDITNISFYKTSNEIFATKRSCNHKLTGKNMRKELLEDYLKSYDCKFYKKCININF